MSTGTDDLVIRVRLDTVQASQEIQKQDKAARSLGTSMGFGMANLALKGTAGLLSLIFGPSAQSSLSNMHAVAGNVGRASWLGQQIERDSAKLSAQESARTQTAEMFGMAGRVASKEQILAVYNALLGMETREATGRQRVEGVIDEKRANETMKAFEYMINNLGAVLSHFLAGFGNNGKPEIK